jgi:hypothetical protein
MLLYGISRAQIASGELGLGRMPTFPLVTAAHSRSKNGVAFARLCPAIHVLHRDGRQDVDARHKAGHDDN